MRKSLDCGVGSGVAQDWGDDVAATGAGAVDVATGRGSCLTEQPEAKERSRKAAKVLFIPHGSSAPHALL